uniref:Uncharacterized protein n=1 Tax=Oryza sativa subsp. japonica TaxID=39947 RepID=Q6YUX3_ORYSJ|nr:hypothetical protein [Oryza sativa Japonica Group]BAD16447.1 hypothetical protein [Oryza sativa Japonica Group]
MRPPLAAVQSGGGARLEIGSLGCSPRTFQFTPPPPTNAKRRGSARPTESSTSRLSTWPRRTGRASHPSPPLSQPGTHHEGGVEHEADYTSDKP